MVWPSTTVSTANLDSSLDSPDLARQDLLLAVQNLNVIKDARNQTNGIAPTDGNNQVPIANLPTQALLPAGMMSPFAGGTAPTGWLLCDGSAVSRSTYAALFSAIGTAWGAGDGSTTFNLPDMRGRVPAGLDNLGGTAANRLQVSLSGTTTAGSAVITGLSGTTGLAVGMSAFGSTLPAGVTIASVDSATQVTLSTGTGVTAGTGTAMRFGFLDAQSVGAAGGAQTHTLTTPQMPSHNHPLAAPFNTTTPGGAATFTAAANVNATGSATSLSTSNTGGGQAHNNVQPTAAVTYIIKT